MLFDLCGFYFLLSLEMPALSVMLYILTLIETVVVIMLDIPDLSNPNKKKSVLLTETAGTSQDVESIGPTLPTDEDAMLESRME